ncbi:MAG: hypothetical protein MJ252_27325 [archaeon]|nr:hypothetical protein [archaeon]
MYSSTYAQFEFQIKEKKDTCLEKVIEELIQSDLYIFPDFLKYPNVQSLKSRGKNKHYNTLELFVLHDYKYYVDHRQDFIPLSAESLTKLRMLTIVELAQTQKVLSFDQLKTALQMPQEEQLNALLFDCLTSGLMKGMVDNLEGKLEIEKVRPRHSVDTKEGQRALQEIIRSIDNASEIIDEQIENLKGESNSMTEEFNTAKTKIGGK